MAKAPVLFLDEPTTGLDPTSRLGVWDVVRGLVSAGVTVLLTTQYLDEADQLADQVVVVDHGRCIAEGTPADLKRSVGGARLEITLSTGGHAGVTAALAGLVEGAVQVSEDGRRVSAPVGNRAGLATTVVRALDAAGIFVDDVEVRQPSLDDVFFALTGPGNNARRLEDRAPAGEQAPASDLVSPAQREEVAI
jgi:ABC-type multidrug transport system ATPase subunit